MVNWVATSFGALDLRGNEIGEGGYELVVLPAEGTEPVFLFGEGADLWRDLVAGPPHSEPEASASAHEVLHALGEMGIASPNLAHPARLTSIDRPWLVSPIHELVYALLANVAAQENIEILFIKGPTLHAQGLRIRKHSGDVDCWVRPGDDLRLATAMSKWGWTPLFSPFTGTGVPHSLTLRAGGWGCAIDVHSRFPGMNMEPLEAFELVTTNSEEQSFAGVKVRTPVPSVHAVIAALHDVRPYLGAPPSHEQLAKARFALKAAGPETIQMADQMGAGFVMGDSLRATFPELKIEFADERPPADWEFRLSPPGPRRYVKALALVPRRQRPGVVARLLWPSSTTLRIGYETPAASWWSLATMRIARIWRSALALLLSR